jgi:hypothetical protein
LSPLEEKTEAVPGADGDQMIREVFLLCTSCTRTVQIQIHSANRACQMGFHTSTRQCVQKIVAVSVLDHGDVGFHIGRNRVVCLPVATDGGGFRRKYCRNDQRLAGRSPSHRGQDMISAVGSADLASDSQWT